MTKWWKQASSRKRMDSTKVLAPLRAPASIRIGMRSAAVFQQVRSGRGRREAMANLNQFDMPFSVASAASGQFCLDAPLDASHDLGGQPPAREIHALSSIKPHVLALAMLASSALWCVLGWTVHHAAVWWAR